MTQHGPEVTPLRHQAPAPAGEEPGAPTKQAWRAAVAEMAEKARAALPSCADRIAKAVPLVLAGAVEFLPDGTAVVTGGRNGTTYNVVDGRCTCPDATRAPEGWCKHRIASAIAKQARMRLAPSRSHRDTGQAIPEPEPAAALPPDADAPSAAGPSAPERSASDQNPQSLVDAAVAQAEKLCQMTLEMTPAPYRSFLTFLPQHKRVAGTRAAPIYAAIRLPYMSVDGRIKMAFDEHKAKGARLQIQTQFDTEPVSGQLLCRAEVSSELLGTATAHARAFLNGGGVDATNPLENAETSAVGRALGFLGYGLYGTGIASAEEVIQAQTMRDSHDGSEQALALEERPPTERQVAFLRDLLERAGKTEEEIEAEVASLSTSREASARISQLREDHVKA